MSLKICLSMLLLTFALKTVAAPTATPTPSPSPTPAAGAAKTVDNAQSDLGFLEKYPHLKQNLYTEPNSNLYLGLSVGILGLVGDRMLFSANFFQVHYLSDYWDSEVLSISYGTTTANPSYVQSNHFTFRTVPKIRFGKTFSAGPLVGYEYVSFPDISTVLTDDQNQQTKPEPFSTSGWIYGLGLSENFESDKAYRWKVSELAYEETYSVNNAGRGWQYLPDLLALRQDKTPIKAGAVLMIEVGIIF